MRRMREVPSEPWHTGVLIVAQPRGASGLYTKDYPGFEMIVEELRDLARRRGMKSAAMFDRYERLVVQAYANGRTRMGSRAALRGEKPR